MNTTKRILTAILLVLALGLTAGCAGTQTPYEENDAQGYTVSVKYDANGGFFTTNSTVIVDSYALDQLPASSDGKAQAALLPPDDPHRGGEAFTPVKNGYFLAGWYASRTETADGFVYADKWNFEEDLLLLDKAGTYSAQEPVLTLYAAWVPLFEIEIYDLASGEYVNTLTVDPTADAITLPAWDETTGAVEMHDFPQYADHTFNGAYLDAAGTQKVDTPQLTHPGSVDYETGTAKDPVMKLYVDFLEGEWYRIYSVEQFLENDSVNGCYELYADLDFTDKIWPTALMHGNFSGTIIGNGHTISNVSLTQTNNSKVNTGLFGQLTETAVLKDVNFENISLTLQGGTRVAGASFGLLAGTASDKATFENVTVTGALNIDSNCPFLTEDYVIGLLCGMGTPNIDYTGITCQAVGEGAENVTVTVNEAEVTVSFGEG